MTDQENADAASSQKTLRLILSIEAYAALAAGLGLGLVTLTAPLGVWLGLWEFGGGFDLLRLTNPYADWVAGIAFLIATSLFVVASVQKIEAGNRLGVLALVGSISAALAWYVPESFRPPEGTPPIHDITTDTINIPEYVAIAPLRADAANSMEYGSGNNMTPERLRELQAQAYPDIVPQTYSGSRDAVFDRVLAAVDTLGWELVDANRDEGRIEATDTTFWFRFKDDVVIYLEEQGGETILNARSLSRVGISDVGKNAERLRLLFETI